MSSLNTSILSGKREVPTAGGREVSPFTNSAVSLPAGPVLTDRRGVSSLKRSPSPSVPLPSSVCVPVSQVRMMEPVVGSLYPSCGPMGEQQADFAAVGLFFCVNATAMSQWSQERGAVRTL